MPCLAPKRRASRKAVASGCGLGANLASTFGKYLTLAFGKWLAPHYFMHMKPWASSARACCRTCRGRFPPRGPSLARGCQNTTQGRSAPLRVSGATLPKPPSFVKFAACERSAKSRTHDVFSSPGPGLYAGQGQLEHRSICAEVLTHNEVGVLI